MTEHCCNKFEEELKSGEIVTDGNGHYGHYYEDDPVVDFFTHCPWCGRKLR